MSRQNASLFQSWSPPTLMRIQYEQQCALHSFYPYCQRRESIMRHFAGSGWQATIQRRNVRPFCISSTWRSLIIVNSVSFLCDTPALVPLWSLLHTVTTTRFNTDDAAFHNRLQYAHPTKSRNRRRIHISLERMRHHCSQKSKVKMRVPLAATDCPPNNVVSYVRQRDSSTAPPTQGSGVTFIQTNPIRRKRQTQVKKQVSAYCCGVDSCFWRTLSRWSARCGVILLQGEIARQDFDRCYNQRIISSGRVYSIRAPDRT